MLVSDFNFELPPELIAQQPPAVRGSSRMLYVDRTAGTYKDTLFATLPDLLKPGDLLVLNDSRVLPARLFAIRSGLTTQQGSPSPSARVEVLLTSPCANDAGHNEWHALVKPAKKVQPGETLFFFASDKAGAAGAPPLDSEMWDEPKPVLTATVIAAGDFGERTLRFAPVADFYAQLESIGSLPLPPYIHRDKDTPNTIEDRERYQTVYANTPGSVAAPTAGLHFTPDVLARLQTQGIQIARITLHVGLGTFQPVRVERTEDIRLHAEPYTLSEATASALNAAWRDGRRILAAGTTTTRTLEHLARNFIAAHGPLTADNPLALSAHSGTTSLFLSPDGDSTFHLVRGLLTNFHLPQSTLLMLVSAFAGRDAVLRAYNHAVQSHYRFFSYGDCMLLL